MAEELCNDPSHMRSLDDKKIKKYDKSTDMFRYLGILFIILGIISLVVTYRYVIPTGSIFLIIGGLALIFWKFN